MTETEIVNVPREVIEDLLSHAQESMEVQTKVIARCYCILDPEPVEFRLTDIDWWADGKRATPMDADCHTFIHYKGTSDVRQECQQLYEAVMRSYCGEVEAGPYVYTVSKNGQSLRRKLRT